MNTSELAVTSPLSETEAFAEKIFDSDFWKTSQSKTPTKTISSIKQGSKESASMYPVVEKRFSSLNDKHSAAPDAGHPRRHSSNNHSPVAKAAVKAFVKTTKSSPALIDDRKSFADLLSPLQQELSKEAKPANSKVSSLVEYIEPVQKQIQSLHASSSSKVKPAASEQASSSLSNSGENSIDITTEVNTSLNRVKPIKHTILLVPDTLNNAKPSSKRTTCNLRPKICWCCLILLLILSVAIGVTVALTRGKVVNLSDLLNGKSLPNPSIDPNDPSQQLIVNPNLPTGIGGCSNVPLRAPLRGSQALPSQPHFSNDNCASGDFRYTLTECDMLQIMYPSESGMPMDAYFAQYVKQYYNGLITALEIFDCNCARNRISNFLAQVKHETAGLRVMRQRLDGGAGAIHMIPAHFADIIQEVPYINDIYYKSEKSSFSDKKSTDSLKFMGKNYGGLSVDDKAFVDSVGDMLARPDTTFMVAGWWFKRGSHEKMDPSLQCGDLRLDSDQGAGSQSSTTGFYKVTQCVYGPGDPGIGQRMNYYQQISTYATGNFTCQTKSCPSE